MDIAAPRRLAPHSFALGVELADDVRTPVSPLDADVDVTGRLVLLHDPDARDAWAGTFRMVGYLRAPLDVEQADDPLLLEVGWSWLTDALEGATAFLTRAIDWFSRLGVRVQRVMTDKCSAYRSKLLAQALQQAGIRHVRTRPYTPRTNGKAERFIQTSLREWAYARP